MSDFDKVSQQIIPQDFRMRFSIDNCKVRTEDTLDIYTTDRKNILQWCDSTTAIYNRFIDGDDDSKLQAQKTLLATALSDGMQMMSTIRTRCSYFNLNFRNIIRDIDLVLIQITANLDGKIDNFNEENRELYERLQSKIKHLYNNVSSFKNQLRFEVISIDDLKRRIKNTQIVLALDEHFEFHDEILSSVEKMIVECNGYRNKHE